MRHCQPARFALGCRQHRLSSIGVALAVGLTLLAHTPAEPGEPFDRQGMLEHLARRVMLPTYMAFAVATQDLHTAVTRLCEAPTVAHLEATQLAWRQAVAFWKHSEAYQLGPTMGFAMAIDFWPTRPRIIQKVLRSEQPLSPETIEFAGAAAQGLSAIEYLLFDANADPQAMLTHYREAANVPRRCAYLAAAAQHLVRQAQFVAQAWSPDGGNFVAELAQAGRGSHTYTTVHAAISAVVNALLAALEKIKNAKLGKPLHGSGQAPWPESTEAWRSDNSLANLLHNLQGLHDVYTGTAGTVNGPGFDDYLTALGSPLGQHIIQQFHATLAAVRAIPPPLRVAVVEQSQTVAAAYQEVKTLLILLKVDMTNLLSITVDFSDNDGD